MNATSPAEPAPATTSRPGRAARAAFGALTTLLLLGLVLLAGAVVVVPRVLGAVPLAVLSGSMEPTYSPGDLVVSRPVSGDDVAPGDVITFQPTSGDPTLVTHRVVRVYDGDGGRRLVTRGDANTADDAPLVAEQVMGKVAYRVPWAGFVTTTGWGPKAAGVVAVGLVVYGVGTLARPDRGEAGCSRPRRRRREGARGR
ncbi:signal peptidase I [Xylanimonas ulmi]|uniref:Signal peptidase I n=1 Tax=Xylanimonas ulmi TaxID=228973 RepID=A0A4Q7M298_9MICO|nr:signal peptidase I [Xylanibacterium ulmi]RZS61995.1 signal peptidase [Xylanibacterium ulmi]